MVWDLFSDYTTRRGGGKDAEEVNKPIFSLSSKNVWCIVTSNYCWERIWCFSKHRFYKFHSSNTRVILPKSDIQLCYNSFHYFEVKQAKGEVCTCYFCLYRFFPVNDVLKLVCALPGACHSTWCDWLGHKHTQFVFILIVEVDSSRCNNQSDVTNAYMFIQLYIKISLCVFLILVFHTFNNVFYEISNILGWERKALCFNILFQVLLLQQKKINVSPMYMGFCLY